MNPAPRKWFYVYLPRTAIQIATPCRMRINLKQAKHPSKYCVIQDGMRGLLISERNNFLYIGCTSNLRKRLTFHKNGKVYPTRRMLPMNLIYFEAIKSQKDAFEREKKFKLHGNTLRNLKLSPKNIFSKGGAG